MSKIYDFIESVLWLRRKWNFSVTSWGRTFARNRLVGGVQNSDHLMWNAMDIVLDENIKNEQFEKDCAICGLKVLWEGDHYHISPV